MRVFGKSTGGGRRKSARSQEPLQATLSTVSSDYRVGLVNLSSTGAQVSAPCLPELGEGVIFKADKVVSLGQVVGPKRANAASHSSAPLRAWTLSGLGTKRTRSDPFTVADALSEWGIANQRVPATA